MKFIYFILICFVFCSCTTIPRVVKPVNLQSYDKYKNPDNLQIDEAKKKNEIAQEIFYNMDPLAVRFFYIIISQSLIILLLGFIIFRKNKYIDSNIFREKDF